MFNFLNNFYRSSVENIIYADLSYNSFLDCHDVGVDPNLELFNFSSLDELSFVLDCEKNIDEI